MRRARLAPLVTALVCAACGGPDRAGVEEVFNFMPLAYYETSREPEGYSVDVLWPLVNWYRAGDARGSRVFPLYSENRKNEIEHDLRLLLLYSQAETAQQRSRTLVPLFGRRTWKDDPDRSETWALLFLLGANYDTDYANRWFFPFYFDKDSEHQNTFVLWPFYGFGERNLDGVTYRDDHVAWPLFRFASASDDRTAASRILSFDSLFGLWERERSIVRDTETEDVDAPESPQATESWRNHRSTVALWVLHSLFSAFESTQTDRWGGTRILSLFNRRAGDHFDSRKRESDDSTDYLSLIASSWSNDENDEPIARHSHAFPLYSSSSSRDEGEELHLLFPLYRHHANLAEKSSRHDFLLELWSYGTKGEGASFERHWRLLPLLWFTTRPDTKTHLVLPLYYHLADAENDYFHFIPFYGKNTEAGGKATKTFVLTPLYIGTRDERTERTRTDLLFPLIAWEKSVQGEHSHFYPLWSFHRRAGVTHFNSLVLFNRRYSEIESSTLLYPVWGERTIRGEGRLRSALPVFDFVRHLASSSLAPRDEFSFLYPLSSFRTEGEGYDRWIFPLYWWSDDAAGRSSKHFWPFFGVSRDSDAVTRSVIAPLFSYGSKPDGSWRELHLLRPLFAKTHSAGDGEGSGTDHVRFFPFFWWCSGTDPYAPWSTGWVLWPLWRYQHFESGEVRAHSLFKLGEYERSADGAAEQFQILHALYRYRRDGGHTTRSVPFLFRYETEGDRATLHLFHVLPIEF